MKLPDIQPPIITEAKLRGYLLNSAGADPSKARFCAALGYNQDNWQDLAADILEQIVPLDAEFGRPNPYGTTFEVVGVLQGPRGSATIKTVWIIEEGQVAARLVTAPSRLMSQIELFQTVVLERDLGPPDAASRLEKGSRGVVMELLQQDGIAVEFSDANGKTIDVVFIPASYVRPATKAEVE